MAPWLQNQPILPFTLPKLKISKIVIFNPLAISILSVSGGKKEREDKGREWHLSTIASGSLSHNPSARRNWIYRYISLAGKFSGLTSPNERSTVHFLTKGGALLSSTYWRTRNFIPPISLASYLHLGYGNDFDFSSIILFSTDPPGVGWFLTSSTAREESALDWLRAYP